MYEETNIAAMWGTYSAGLVGVDIKVEGRETGVVGRLGVVCIRISVALLREIDIIRWGTRSGDS